MARVCKQPVKCPGRCCSTSLEDKDQVKQPGKDFCSGLQSTVRPGGSILMSYPGSCGPLLLMESMATANIQRWLRLLQGLTTVGLYRDGNGIPKLPLSGLTEEFQRATSRLQVTLTNSQDAAVKKNPPTWFIRCKDQQKQWKRQQGHVGVSNVQLGRGGCWGNNWLPS